jgi:capsule polysaccharide export protein KpsC/LpsZ
MHTDELLRLVRETEKEAEVFSHFHPDVIENLRKMKPHSFREWLLMNFDTYFDRVITVAEDAKIRRWDRLANADGVTRAVSQSAVRVERIY